MQTRSLIEALTRLADFVNVAGAKKDAKEVRELGEFFESYKDKAVGEALQDVKHLLAEQCREKLKPYLDKLTSAGVDEAKFGQAINLIEKDRSLVKEDAIALAKAYTSRSKNWKSKKDALEAIKKKFAEDLYQASKMKIVREYKAG